MLPPIPAKKQRRIARFAYLPCAHMMDLGPHARVAGILARRGWQCVVGDAPQKSQNASGDMPPGVVMFDAAGIAEARAIYKAQSHGHQVLLHARDGLLDANCRAHELADCRVKPMLALQPREPLPCRNMNDLRRRIAKIFTHVVGEAPTDDTRAALHARIEADYEGVAEPRGVDVGGAEHIANLFHKLWVTQQIDMPWFDVMTAWLARKGDATPTQWADVLPDALVQREAEGCGVYPLSQNVWAVRAKMAALDGEAA